MPEGVPSCARGSIGRALVLAYHLGGPTTITARPRLRTRRQERKNNQERPKQVQNNAQRACTRFCCWRVHHDDVLTLSDRDDAPYCRCDPTELDEQVRSIKLMT